MKTISLEIYKGSMPYFYFFDIKFKELSINKEHYLLDNDITPSSYRRARSTEQKVGMDIISKIAADLKFKVPSSELVDHLEKLSTKIYHYMNYKIYKTYESDLEYLTNLLKDNYIINPIIELLILFLNINSTKRVSVIKSENIKLYEKIKKYKLFYNDDLLSIYELLNIYFEAETDDSIKMKKYDSSMAYFILASQAALNKQYVECLYYAYMSNSLCEKESNIKRSIYLNETIMSSLLHIGSYEECYEVSLKHRLILESLDMNGYDMKTLDKFQAVALLGIKKYYQVIDLLENKKSATITEIVCMLVAKYYTNKKEYDYYLKEELNYKSFDIQSMKHIEIVHKFLTKKDRKSIIELENSKIMIPVLKIIKKL